MTPHELLKEALRLQSSSGLGTGLRGRCSALLLRQALEAELLTRLATVRDPTLPREPSVKVQLLALELIENDARALVDEVSLTWNALSNACHYHGYELPPMPDELRRWSDVVRRFVTRETDGP